MYFQWGATGTPWFTSIPGIFPTTLLVAGSITVMLSPAKLVCRMRGLSEAALNPAAQRTTAVPKTAPRQRNAPRSRIRMNMFDQPPLVNRIYSTLSAENPRLQDQPFGILL